MSATAAFVNRLTINALESASVSMVEVFAGIDFNQSFKFAFDAGAEPTEIPLKALFVPAISGYALPEVAVTSAWGDISVLGIGGNPASGSFANYLSLVFNSVCVRQRALSPAPAPHTPLAPKLAPLTTRITHTRARTRAPAGTAPSKWR